MQDTQAFDVSQKPDAQDVNQPNDEQIEEDQSVDETVKSLGQRAAPVARQIFRRAFYQKEEVVSPA